MKPYLQTLPAHAHTSHRGGSALNPENTTVAFTAAVETWHTDVLELDVQPSLDGHVVVIHDDTLERTTNGTGKVAEHTLAQLQALDAGFHHPQHRGTGVTIPTLSQVLETFPHHHVNIELKDGSDAFFDTFARLVEKHTAHQRLCIGHIKEERSLVLRQRLPDCAFWAPEEAAMVFFMCFRSGQPPPSDTPWEVLALPHRLYDQWVMEPALVAAAHDLGKVVHVWTVDDAAEMDTLWDAGVDSIMTDRPDTLRQVMDRRFGP